VRIDTNNLDRGYVPAAADFPVLDAGKDWSAGPYHFPGSKFMGKAPGPLNYALLKPGEYRIRVVYTNDKELPIELAKGSWSGGLLTSNELVLKVKPANAK
jgi:hypothetical protein